MEITVVLSGMFLIHLYFLKLVFHCPFLFTMLFCVWLLRLIPLKTCRSLWDFPSRFCSIVSPISSTVLQIKCKLFRGFLTVLKSEVHDLRIVLQSADKELSSVKLEYNTFREKQEREISQLSGRHMDVQFQLDSVRYVGSLVQCLVIPSGCIQWFNHPLLYVNLHFTCFL